MRHKGLCGTALTRLCGACRRARAHVVPARSRAYLHEQRSVSGRTIPSRAASGRQARGRRPGRGCRRRAGMRGAGDLDAAVGDGPACAGPGRGGRRRGPAQGRAAGRPGTSASARGSAAPPAPHDTVPPPPPYPRGTSAASTRWSRRAATCAEHVPGRLPRLPDQPPHPSPSLPGPLTQSRCSHGTFFCPCSKMLHATPSILMYTFKKGQVRGVL